MMFLSIYSIVLDITFIIFCYVSCRNILGPSKKEIHEMKMREERNSQVFAFRSAILTKYGAEFLLRLPSYDEMLDSSKPLILSEWIEVDDLVNLN